MDMGREQGNIGELYPFVLCLYFFNWCGLLSLSGVEKPVASATPAGDFGIGPEQLVLMSKDHNITSLKQYGGVKFSGLLVGFFWYFIFFFCPH